jgi:hypothetical protein
MRDSIFQFGIEPVEIVCGVLALPLAWVAERLDRSLFAVPDLDVDWPELAGGRSAYLISGEDAREQDSGPMSPVPFVVDRQSA